MTSTVSIGKDMDEREAIQQLNKGNLDGLEWLVMQYQVSAIRTAFLITRDTQTAEDIVQEEFLRFSQHLYQFDPSRPFKPWFLRCVTYSAIKAAQKQNRHISLETSQDGLSFEESLVLQMSSPEQQVADSEFQAKVWGALGRLSPKQRAVIIQRYYLEMTEKEMSRHLGNAPGTVKWLLNAARCKLKAILSFERDER